MKGIEISFTSPSDFISLFIAGTAVFLFHLQKWDAVLLFCGWEKKFRVDFYAFFVNLFALKNSQNKKMRYLDTALVLSLGMADPRNWNVKKSCAG